MAVDAGAFLRGGGVDADGDGVGLSGLIEIGCEEVRGWGVAVGVVAEVVAVDVDVAVGGDAVEADFQCVVPEVWEGECFFVPGGAGGGVFEGPVVREVDGEGAGGVCGEAPVVVEAEFAGEGLGEGGDGSQEAGDQDV